MNFSEDSFGGQTQTENNNNNQTSYDDSLNKEIKIKDQKGQAKYKPPKNKKKLQKIINKENIVFGVQQT